MNKVEQLKLLRELTKLKEDYKTAKGKGEKVKTLKAGKEIKITRGKLGYGKVNNQPVADSTTSTALFNYNEEGVTAKARQKRNNQAIEIIKQLQNGEIDAAELTDEQKQTLSLEFIIN